MRKVISEKLQKSINQHINREIYSAYLYASMGAYFDATSLDGFSNWMRVQVQEELSHVARFWSFLSNRGGRVLLTPIDGPPTEWDSPLAVMEAVHAHEQEVSRGINELVDQVTEERDHMAREFLQWFLAEQVEEEASADKIVQDLKKLGDNGHGLLMIDRELSGRVFTPPADSKA
jgi:ferritin